jgi:hypothetical protein
MKQLETVPRRVAQPWRNSGGGRDGGPEGPYSLKEIGGGGGSRTRTRLFDSAFKSCASASSATPPSGRCLKPLSGSLHESCAPCERASCGDGGLLLAGALNHRLGQAELLGSGSKRQRGDGGEIRVCNPIGAVAEPCQRLVTSCGNPAAHSARKRRFCVQCFQKLPTARRVAWCASVRDRGVGGSNPLAPTIT